MLNCIYAYHVSNNFNSIKPQSHVLSQPQNLSAESVFVSSFDPVVAHPQPKLENCKITNLRGSDRTGIARLNEER